MAKRQIDLYGKELSFGISESGGYMSLATDNIKCNKRFSYKLKVQKQLKSSNCNRNDQQTAQQLTNRIKCTRGAMQREVSLHFIPN